MVLDHLPQLDPPTEPTARRQLQADLRELAARPQVYVKLSAVLRRVDGQVHFDLDFYRSRLDELWGIFGEDRVIFGSDWPNSDTKGSYQQGLNVIHEYVTGKGEAVAEKFFWKNSIRAYRWVKRAANQPELNKRSWIQNGSAVLAKQQPSLDSRCPFTFPRLYDSAPCALAVPCYRARAPELSSGSPRPADNPHSQSTLPPRYRWTRPPSIGEFHGELRVLQGGLGVAKLRVIARGIEPCQVVMSLREVRAPGARLAGKP